MNLKGVRTRLSQRDDRQKAGSDGSVAALKRNEVVVNSGAEPSKAAERRLGRQVLWQSIH